MIFRWLLAKTEALLSPQIMGQTVGTPGRNRTHVDGASSSSFDVALPERRMSTGVLVRKHGTSEGANHSHDILCMWDIVRDFSIGSLKSRVDARASANCSPKGLLQMPLQHIHISCVTYIHSSNVFRLASSSASLIVRRGGAAHGNNDGTTIRNGGKTG